jgi:hypothetical protein
MDSKTSEAGMTQGLPVDILEKRAQDQRSLLENRVIELRRAVKDRLDVKRQIQGHVRPAAGILALVGLALGYAVAGVFTRD